MTLIENLTVQEYEMLKKAVSHLLGNWEDDAYRYKLSKIDNPNQDGLTTIRSLSRKLGMGGY